MKRVFLSLILILVVGSQAHAIKVCGKDAPAKVSGKASAAKVCGATLLSSPMTIYVNTSDAYITSDCTSCNNYTATRAGNNLSVTANATTAYIQVCQSSCTPNCSYTFRRYFLDVDFSQLAGKTIDSVVLHGYCEAVLSTPTILLYTGTQSIPVTTSDWTNFGSAASSSHSPTASTWSEITLNSTGVSHAQSATGGTFKLVVLHGQDTSTPVSYCGYARFTTSDSASNRPHVVVTFH